MWNRTIEKTSLCSAQLTGFLILLFPQRNRWQNFFLSENHWQQVEPQTIDVRQWSIGGTANFTKKLGLRFSLKLQKIAVSCIDVIVVSNSLSTISCSSRDKPHLHTPTLTTRTETLTDSFLQHAGILPKHTNEQGSHRWSCLELLIHLRIEQYKPCSLNTFLLLI